MQQLLETLKAAWAKAGDDKIDLMAAGIAFYAFLALVPLLAALVLTYGMFANPMTMAEHTVSLARTLPPSATDLVREQLFEISQDRDGASGWGLAVALALSLFAARVAAGAIIQAFNTSFGALESRGLIKANLLALAITLGAILALAVLAAATALVTTYFAGSINGVISFTIVGLAGVGGAFIAYLVVPNTDSVSKSAAFHGAALFAGGWTIASILFGYYAANIANYNATYGSLGTIVILLTWLFLSAYLLVFGAYFARAQASD